MSISEALQNASSAIKEGSNAVKIAGTNDRTSLLVVIFCIFVFVAGLFFYAIQSINTIQKENSVIVQVQRQDFLKYMELRDDKATQRDEKITEALNKNTEAFIELKAKIKQ